MGAWSLLFLKLFFTKFEESLSRSRTIGRKSGKFASIDGSAPIPAVWIGSQPTQKVHTKGFIQ